jgi:hypothetical protein
VATSTQGSPRRVPTWLLVLGAGAVVVLVALVAVLATIALRPAPSAAAPVPAATPQAVPSETPLPAASASPGAGSPAASASEDQKRYRTYVSTFVRHGASIAATLSSLQACQAGRPQCHDALAAARAQVDEYQQQLDANPAPSCLSATDQRMRDGLDFQAQGLQLMQSAIDSQDRVALMQGLGLVVAGVWREGQAAAAVRSANC